VAFYVAVLWSGRGVRKALEISEGRDRERQTEQEATAASQHDMNEGRFRLFYAGLSESDLQALKVVWKKRFGVEVVTPEDGRWDDQYSEAYNRQVMPALYKRIGWEQFESVDSEAMLLGEKDAPPIPWAILTTNSGFNGLHDIWSPSEGEIPAIIANSRTFLTHYAESNGASENGRDSFEKREIPKINAHWHLYACQVVGHLASNGHRLIRLNFFRRPFGELHGYSFGYWKTRYVEAMDGGYSFWHIDYDVEAKAYTDFASNGYG
jgi:hypothetical protein